MEFNSSFAEKDKMKILKFMEEFPREKACKAHFNGQKEQERVKCKQCNNTHHYWLKVTEQWPCSLSNFRTTLKAVV
jgi:hypothetical protein